MTWGPLVDTSPTPGQRCDGTICLLPGGKIVYFARVLRNMFRCFSRPRQVRNGSEVT